MPTTKNISLAFKGLALALGTLFLLTSCKVLGKDGLVLMTDDSYKASVFATNKTGFGSPDGILWKQGKLYLADEGAGALEVWDQNGGVKKLLDTQFGAESPEDLVMDAQGNVFFSDDDAGGVRMRRSFTMNRFSPAPSLTVPSDESPMPSTKPRRLASRPMSWLDR